MGEEKQFKIICDSCGKEISVLMYCTAREFSTMNALKTILKHDGGRILCFACWKEFNELIPDEEAKESG